MGTIVFYPEYLVPQVLTAVDDAASTPYQTPVVVAVLANDDLDGVPPTIAEVSLVVLVPAINGTPVVNPDGTITYTPDAGFSGIDTFVYQIASLEEPSVTAQATVTITVEPCPIVATDDNAAVAAPGVAIANVRANDTVCGDPATAVNSTLAIVTAVPPELTFDTVTGAVSVNVGAAGGVYSFTYRLAQLSTPTNGDNAEVTVTYTPPPVGCTPPVCGCVMPAC